MVNPVDSVDTSDPTMAIPALGPKMYQIDLSPDNLRWQTIMTHDDLPMAREMAAALLTDHVKNGMFHARVQKHVVPTYTYRASVSVVEEGVN